MNFQELKHLFLISVFCVLASLSPAGAQSRFLPQADPADSSITVSLLTCAPGSDIYELEGHSGLRMQYAGEDLTANWGLFDFASPGFVYRFVRGETDYSVGVCPTEYFIESYRRHGRRVTEQTINLTTVQAARVIDLVEENLLPENRIYRYNYVKDNCATRPLQILERAIGDTVTFTSTADQLGMSATYRSEMRYFHRNYPWYQFGIDLALGSGLDYQISTRETIFAPVILQQLAAEAVITTSDGSIPFVRSTQILTDGPSEGPVEPPTPWYLTPMFAGCLVLLLTLILTLRDLKRKRIAGWFDALLFSVFGLDGIIIAFLVFVSVHEASSPNWLLLWLNPFCLLVPLTQWINPLKKIALCYHCYNIPATLMLATIFIFGIQIPNPAFYPFMAAGLLRSFANLKNSSLF